MVRIIKNMINDMLDQAWTLLGMFIAWVVLDGSAKVVVGYGIFVTAIITAIVGDYVTAAMETQVTGEPVEVSAEVMTLVQTALGGLIGIIGGYFGAKANNKDKEE